LDHAEEIFRKVLEFAEKEKKYKEGWRVVALCNLGVIYATRGETVKAEEMYNEALSISEKIDDKGRWRVP
jgi:Tfp pilus assembly protein PilF